MSKVKNRILFLLHVPPPVHGSSIVGLSIKENCQINQAYECTFINLLASNNVAESGKINIRKIYEFIITFLKVFISITYHRPKICYLALTSTGAAFYRDVLLVAMLKIFQIKRIYHLHNKGVSQYQKKKYYKLCYQFVFTNVDVILLSKHLYPDIQGFVPVTRTYVCPNGIVDQVICQKSKVKKVETQTPKILFLSNLIESKGVFILLEAMALLAQNGIAFEGIFIGGEGDITALQFQNKVRQLKLDSLVSYQGKKYGEEKEQVFSEANIFAFPTYYSSECFPLVLLEAMQYSLPIISTFEGGIKDIVEEGNNGFLVPQRNVELLAEKLELLIKDPELRKNMGKAGRMKYEKEFTLERFEQRMVEILNSAIARK